MEGSDGDEAETLGLAIGDLVPGGLTPQGGLFYEPHQCLNTGMQRRDVRPEPLF